MNGWWYLVYSQYTDWFHTTYPKPLSMLAVWGDVTRERILQKAVEMAYKQFSYISTQGYN